MAVPLSASDQEARERLGVDRLHLQEVDLQPLGDSIGRLLIDLVAAGEEAPS